MEGRKKRRERERGREIAQVKHQSYWEEERTRCYMEAGREVGSEGGSDAGLQPGQKKIRCCSVENMSLKPALDRIRQL